MADDSTEFEYLNSSGRDASSDYDTAWVIDLDPVEHAAEAAAQAGMTPQPSSAFAADPDRSLRIQAIRERTIHRRDLHLIPPIEYLLLGLLPLNSISFLTGERDSAKSFLAMSWAGAIGTGRPWHGQETKHRRALYMIGEAPSGADPRAAAWEIQNGLAYSEMDVTFLTKAIQALTPSGGRRWEISPAWLDFAHYCAEEGFGLIVIDTLARIIVGADENSNVDMGVLIAALEALREITGACVLVVAHSGKGGRGIRGASCLEGGADMIIHASRKRTAQGGKVKVECLKPKDSAPFADLRFSHVSLGPSAVLIPIEDPGPMRDESSDPAVLTLVPRAGDYQEELDAISEHFAPGERFGRAEWAARLDVSEADAENASRNVFSPLCQRGLLRHNEVTRRGRLYWLPEDDPDEQTPDSESEEP